MEPDLVMVSAGGVATHEVNAIYHRVLCVPAFIQDFAVFAFEFSENKTAEDAKEAQRARWRTQGNIQQRTFNIEGRKTKVLIRHSLLEESSSDRWRFPDR